VDHASIQLALLCVCPSLNRCSLQLLTRTGGPWNWFRVSSPAIQIQIQTAPRFPSSYIPGLLNLAPNLPAVPSTHMQPQKAFATFSPTSFTLARFSRKLWRERGKIPWRRGFTFTVSLPTKAMQRSWQGRDARHLHIVSEFPGSICFSFLYTTDYWKKIVFLALSGKLIRGLCN
jgi:hypothetical protein